MHMNISYQLLLRTIMSCICFNFTNWHQRPRTLIPDEYIYMINDESYTCKHLIIYYNPLGSIGNLETTDCKIIQYQNQLCAVWPICWRPRTNIQLVKEIHISNLNQLIKQQNNEIDSLTDQIKQQDAQIRQLQTQLKQQETIDMQDKQLKQQADQLKVQAEWIKEYNDKSLAQSNQLESKHREVSQLIDLVTTKQQTIDTLETQIILIRSDLVQQFYQSDQTIDKLSTQMISIQPDLLQLSDLYYGQQSKSNKLEAELQCKNNQLAEQEDNIKQLLAALGASQSKQGLASAISSYFK